jgi:hypothetical protein
VLYYIDMYKPISQTYLTSIEEEGLKKCMISLLLEGGLWVFPLG